MKLTHRDRTVLQILGIVAVSALTITTMFYPDVLGNKQSLVAIENNKATVEQLNGTLRSTESSLQQTQASLNALKQESEANKGKAERMRNAIENTNFTFHMPSILIALEQKANEFDLDLLIEHDKIQAAGAEDAPLENGMPGDPGNPDMSGDDVPEGTLPTEEAGISAEAPSDDPANPADKSREERLQEIQERKENNEDALGQGGPAEDMPDSAETKTTTPETATERDVVEPEEKPEEKPEEIGTAPKEGEQQTDTNTYDPAAVDTSAAFKNVPAIPGISVTLVPVRVTGTYANVRSFIQYLDEVDFMEHNFIDLYSYGENVSGIMVFNVFHTAEGGGSY